MKTVAWRRCVFDFDVWLARIEPSPCRDESEMGIGAVRKSPTGWFWWLWVDDSEGFSDDFETSKAELERSWARYEAGRRERGGEE